MKKTFILSLIFLTINIKSQERFKWETIDSIAKSKEQLYSATKEYIAEKYNSAKDVIQNDDKAGGIIIIKAITQKYSYKYMMNYHDFIYEYTMKFSFKDKKYKVELYNVSCYSHYCGAVKWNCIEPMELITEKVEGMPVDKLKEMMNELKKELGLKFQSYNNYIYTSATNNNW